MIFSIMRCVHCDAIVQKMRYIIFGSVVLEVVFSQYIQCNFYVCIYNVLCILCIMFMTNGSKLTPYGQIKFIYLSIYISYIQRFKPKHCGENQAYIPLLNESYTIDQASKNIYEFGKCTHSKYPIIHDIATYTHIYASNCD